MYRRELLALVGGVTTVAGCATAGYEGMRSDSPTPTVSAEKVGSVDNHRTTVVDVVSHEARRRTSGGETEWVVSVTLRIDSQTGTPYPIGLFFVFLNEDGEKVYEVYEQVSPNTSGTARTETRSVPFRPEKATSETFDRYRIDVVHA